MESKGCDKMIVLNIDGKPHIVFKPLVEVLHIEFLKFCLTNQNYYVTTIEGRWSYNLTDLIKKFSPYQIGQVIPIDCEEHCENGKWVTNGIRTKTNCKSCNGTGKQHKTIKSIRLKQAKDIWTLENMEQWHNDKVLNTNPDEWFLVGEL